MATRKKKSKKQNIDPLPSGRWRVRWTDEAGKRRSSTHATKADAELEHRPKMVEVEERRRGLRGMRPVDSRLADVWTMWRRERGEDKRSADSDESYWRIHLEPALGDRGVGTIDSGVVAAFTRQQESNSQLGDASVYHHLALLTTLLRFAHMKGWLNRVPVIKKPPIHLEDMDFRYLKSEEEVGRVLDAARVEGPLVHMLYAVPALSGLRLGEVCGLRGCDVDLDRSDVAPISTGHLAGGNNVEHDQLTTRRARPSAPLHGGAEAGPSRGGGAAGGVDLLGRSAV